MKKLTYIVLIVLLVSLSLLGCDANGSKIITKDQYISQNKLTQNVITTEIDHAVMLYRDVSGMGRFPIDIYREPIRGVLTFALPVGIMMRFPVKALFGLLSPMLIIYALLFSLLFFYFSLKIWDWSLKKYSSASS